jgi:23S rRNA (pseudouridine1915-N3)-methyltransferase
LKFILLNIGKTNEKNIIEGIAHYFSRIKYYHNFEIEDLSITYKSKTDSVLIKEQEGKSILAKIQNTDFLILLDEKGHEFTSRELAKKLEHIITSSGSKHIFFVTGGAYGFSQEVYQRANLKLSLSKLTFPHQLVRLIFCEQLYRAFTIIKGEKYHHD